MALRSQNSGWVFSSTRLGDDPLGRLPDHLQDRRLQVLAHQDLAPLLVDDLALLVHDVVVLEQVLADLEVVGFHLGLGVFDGPADQVVLDGLPVLQAELLHEAGDALAAENAQQVVLQRHVEAGGARVPLAAGAAPQLVVDAARLVPLGAQNVQPAQIDHPLAQNDVGAAAGHVGGDGHRPPLAGPGDDLGLLFVVLGVEHLVRDAPGLELLAQLLGDVDVDRAHQDGLPLGVERTISSRAASYFSRLVL
jgi:hypothetical protein